MFGGLSFVIASLLEGAIVNYLGQENKPIQRCTGCSCCTKNSNSKKDQEQDQEKKSPQLHKVSRVVFPAASALFNVGYWAYYINRPDNKK